MVSVAGVAGFVRYGIAIVRRRRNRVTNEWRSQRQIAISKKFRFCPILAQKPLFFALFQKLFPHFSPTCDKKDLVVEVSSNSVLRALREEKAAKISGGLYHETQVRLNYNSNRIEGSRLTEDQTRLIIETRTIGADYTLPRTKSTEQSKTSASLMILSSDGSYLPRFQSKNRAFEIFVCV